MEVRLEEQTRAHQRCKVRRGETAFEVPRTASAEDSEWGGAGSVWNAVMCVVWLQRRELLWEEGDPGNQVGKVGRGFQAIRVQWLGSIEGHWRATRKV